MAKTTLPSKFDDVIDSRDIIEAIETLENDSEALGEYFTEADELAALKALAEEASGTPDWKYGETLIRDSYFREYAEQLAKDCDMVDANASWPNNCIDWERAARELQYDYTAVDFDGVTYWVRS